MRPPVSLAPPDRSDLTGGGTRQRGSVSVEMAILTPAFLLLIITAIMFGRTAVAAHAIDIAAHDAARAASISRTGPAATANAVAAAEAALERQGLDCAGDPVIEPDVSGFATDTLELTFVSVTITCEVSFTDVAIAGVPENRLLTTTFISPIDIFRERS
jgi:Flp pilus assembly protein TadG